MYLSLTTLLGVIISYGLHAIIELWYLWRSDPSTIVWHSHLGLGACALAPVVDYGLLVGGIIGGFLVGRLWWRWVYVERRWWRTEETEPRG